MTSIFAQCETSLSPMRHYDFHLRAILAAVYEATQSKSEIVPTSEAIFTESDEIAVIGKSIKALIGPTLVETVPLPFSP